MHDDDGDDDGDDNHIEEEMIDIEQHADNVRGMERVYETTICIFDLRLCTVCQFGGRFRLRGILVVVCLDDTYALL